MLGSLCVWVVILKLPALHSRCVVVKQHVDGVAVATVDSLKQ